MVWYVGGEGVFGFLRRDQIKKKGKKKRKEKTKQRKEGPYEVSNIRGIGMGIVYMIDRYIT